MSIALLKPITCNAGSRQFYTNIRPEAGESGRRCTNINKSNCYTNMGNNSNLNNSNAFIPIVNSNEIKYFLPGPNKMTTKSFLRCFSGTGCFDGTFSLQVNPDSKPYHMPQRCVAYALQKPFKEELEQLKQQDIITPPGMDNTAEQYQTLEDFSMENELSYQL